MTDHAPKIALYALRKRLDVQTVHQAENLVRAIRSELAIADYECEMVLNHEYEGRVLTEFTELDQEAARKAVHYALLMLLAQGIHVKHVCVMRDEDSNNWVWYFAASFFPAML